MTVGELISRLQNYHDATPVLVDGYEDGYDRLGMRLLRVKKCSRDIWYLGTFEEDENGTEALVLQRIKEDERNQSAATLGGKP